MKNGQHPTLLRSVCFLHRGCSPSFGGSGPFAALSMPGGDPASKGMAERHCKVFFG